MSEIGRPDSNFSYVVSFINFRKAWSLDLTFNFSLFMVIWRQLSVEKLMAKRAAATREKIEAKHKVTALQKAILF